MTTNVTTGNTTLERAVSLAEHLLGIRITDADAQIEYCPQSDAWYIRNLNADGEHMIVWSSGFMIGRPSMFSFQRRLQRLRGAV